MGPVSFSRFNFSTRFEALEAAQALTRAGIRVQSVDADTTLLVRSDDQARAAAAIDELFAPDDSVLAVEPLEEPFSATVDVPGSKSHTNRGLLCAALATGPSTLTRVLLADDTAAMLESLRALGVDLTIDQRGPVSATVMVRGVGGGESGRGAQGDSTQPSGRGFAVDGTARINVRQSGTTGRFLLPALAAGQGRFLLDGHPQLRERPFGPQLEALRTLGAEIIGSRLPLEIHGRSLKGGRITLSGDLSSQFLSGLLLAAPLFAAPTVLSVDGELVSKPYVELTVHTMRAFGVPVDADIDAGRFSVPVGHYRPTTLAIEPDASAAAYFFAAAAMTGSRVKVEGLGRSTVQGDIRFVELLERMGAEVTMAEDFIEVRGTGRLVGIRADMADISDTAQTLAVVAACAHTPSEITGVGFIRHKETDRIAAPVAELRRLGIDARATDDGFIVRPGRIKPGVVETYDDHRMAMSFALLGLVHPGIEIANPGCVNKTFPNFFDMLAALRSP
ncbi:MAG: 3-phosphoshikimate 1-carboxyvinyltransferase [Acidimicrobiia bacterium]|nr:3-phosphoshikimate 1-carboxyvinyltransferase [Acidimicrobiia bacterium]